MRKRPWPSLMNLAFITLSLRSLPHLRQDPRERPLIRLQAPSERPSLPYLPFQNDPASRWANAQVTKDQESVHGRRTHGKGSDEGWVASSYLKVPSPTLGLISIATKLSYFTKIGQIR